MQRKQKEKKRKTKDEKWEPYSKNSTLMLNYGLYSPPPLNHIHLPPPFDFNKAPLVGQSAYGKGAGEGASGRRKGGGGGKRGQKNI